ncbi:hypothetical protein LMH66_17375, partial [Shewanella sp. 10N.7]|uniref:hypothetical protein n=1 Tax=Shewanella sp. 10N.7 TaxID=2885093 RepID=UPI001E4034E1
GFDATGKSGVVGLPSGPWPGLVSSIGLTISGETGNSGAGEEWLPLELVDEHAVIKAAETKVAINLTFICILSLS